LDEILKIGVTRGGSIGDILNLSAIATSIKRQFPQSYITAIVSTHPEILRDNKVVDRIICIPVATFQKYVDEHKKTFDIFLEYKYACQWTFSDKVLALPGIQDFKRLTEKRYKKYSYIFEKFLLDIPAMNRMGKSYWEIASDSLALKVSPDDMFISIHPEDYKAAEKYKDLKYVTINNSSAGGFQTKNWKSAYWKDVTTYLRKLNIVPIQIGEKTDFPIEGAERFLGTIFETVALIKGAYFNISCEGGIVHLARVVGVKSIVLFGPTTMHVFEYKENINIRSNVCKPCWWRTLTWYHTCPLINEKVSNECPAPCMDALKPELVIKSINKLLVEREYKMKYLEPSINMDKDSLKAALWHKEQEILKKVAGTPMEIFEAEVIKLPLDVTNYTELAQAKRVAAILKEVGTGKKVLSVADGGYIGNLIRLQGNKVTVTDISEIRTLRCKYLLKFEAYQCRAEKLPFKDQTFDVVILAEILEHIPNMSMAIQEAERVLKPYGKLILTVPVGRRHDPYPEHLKKIQLTTIQDDKGNDDMIVLGIETIKDHYDDYMKNNRNAEVR
jgi:ADP-heptose:LPS heptosyltransferase/2-polyprenyl-3-methyl-5-hydroxy-6-metoxy-1,4-benzoquinol methylase